MVPLKYFTSLFWSNVVWMDTYIITWTFFSQVDNNDLLHAVVGLYDVSLSEMTPEVIYATICEKWARTVLLIADESGTLTKEAGDFHSETSSHLSMIHLLI